MTPSDPLGRLAAAPEVAAAVTQARAAVDALLGHRVLRRRSAEVSAESSLRAARASAALDGHHVELERLRGQLMHGDAPDDPVVAASVRLNAELGQLRGVWESAPPQALARLHSVAAHGITHDDDLGRPRSHDLPGAPSPQEVASRLAGLWDVLLAPTAAPAIVVAAVVHGELLSLRPFGVADGLVARAASRLVLIGRGLDPKAVSVPEVGHVEQGHRPGEAYTEALAAYRSGDVVTWLVHCAVAVGLGAREGQAICEALVREEP